MLSVCLTWRLYILQKPKLDNCHIAVMRPEQDPQFLASCGRRAGLAYLLAVSFGYTTAH